MWEHTNTLRLTARDWEVLQKYVPQVLSLTFHHDSEAPLYRNILKALQQSPVAQPPLPNLQCLYYHHCIPEDYPLLDILFVPSLKGLAIDIRPASFLNISLLISPLATLCPHLTFLHIFGYRSHEPIKATVSDIIMGLPHLQMLHRDELSQAAITSIAWRPSLDELDIIIPSDHQYDFSQFPHPTLPRIPPFSGIKIFKMTSLHLTAITALFRQSNPRLPICRLRRAKGRHLKICKSFSCYPFHQHHPDASIDMDIIKPLLRFSKLRGLHLMMINSYLISDEDTVMGASWLCLEIINLDNGDARARPSAFTLRGLMSLVNKCPRLNSAYLPIDANVLEGIDECPASMVGANDLH
ncbi:uncharacterized protein EDB91DRAFT_1267311 [Suillus paluster]|uniref:uncharacterized protein n=1 Tax=Suillus paluster TaxID=48578 RepID=UPI001B87BD7B|nr:uncharacterized protein EDB91DRAFT_1267311 [Suillus paluster]KAG1746705.1 hypothetical protein EDB91DRAFT_1267311 [Suillus paluster]